jgi:uncharacterized protein YbaP (TraB family)
VLFALAACARAEEGPALWRVRDDDSEIFLLGTVHVLPKDVHWQTPKLMKAFASAEIVYFETPTDEGTSREVAALVQRYGFNPPGKTLSFQLEPPLRTQLVRVAGNLNFPLTELERMRPWFASLNLSLALLAKEGNLREAGVEAVLEREAMRLGKERRYFETAEEQISLLAGLSQSSQIRLLRSTLRQIEEDPAASAQLDDLWAQGRAAELATLLEGMISEAGPEVERALLTKRNENWTAVIDRLMQGKGRIFIAVGAAHMAGPKGVPALLEARGYKVVGPY